MKDIIPDSLKYLVNSYWVHVVSTIAVILLFALYNTSAGYFKTCVTLFPPAIFSLGMIGYEVRNLHCKKYSSKGFIRALSLINAILGFMSISAWTNNYLMEALLLVFILSALALFAATFRLGKLVTRDTLEKSPVPLSYLLENRPKDVVNLLITTALLVLIGIVFLTFRVLTDTELPVPVLIISIVIKLTLLYSLSRGSSWAKFFFYTLPFASFVLGCAVLIIHFTLSQLAGLITTAIYLLILRVYYEKPEVKKWLRYCYLARKGRVESA